MKTIQVEDDVYAAIEKRAQGFHQTPDAVLRRILDLPAHENRAVPTAIPAPNTPAPIDDLLQSRDYLAATTADERYLKLISWLLRHHSELREKLHDYRMRSRIYFSSDSKQIEGSAQNVTVKMIPGLDFRFFAMVTLDNRGKRKIVSRVLVLAGYRQAQIERVLSTLPDSGISRGKVQLPDEDFAP